MNVSWALTRKVRHAVHDGEFGAESGLVEIGTIAIHQI